VHAGLDCALAGRATGVAAAVLEEHLRLPRALAGADRDPLTGLLNRRAFETSLAHAVAEAQESGLALSLLVAAPRPDPAPPAGVDGERALRLVAQLLGRCLRADDRLFRIDDGHIGVIVAGEETEALAIAARVTAAARQVRSRVPPIAVGVSVLSARSPEELVADARAALEAAAPDGRS
jgi:GGDEF domain-containing protein